MTDTNETLSLLGRQLLETFASQFPDRVVDAEGQAHGWVRTTGGPGIAVGCDAPLACALTSALFGREIVDPQCDEVPQALAELANIVAGNARAVLELTGALTAPGGAHGPLADEVLAEGNVPTPAGDLRVMMVAASG